jgi:RNA-directed DNA polymerase
MLMEEVVRRENLLSALKRVRTNKGSPGTDGMTVEELPDYLKKQWHGYGNSCYAEITSLSR